MKHLYLLISFALLSTTLTAQNKVRGIVKDAGTGEALPGAFVYYNAEKGAATDFDGLFEFSLPDGTYEFRVNYVNYQELKKSVVVKGAPLTLEFLLESNTMSEVEIIGDVAVDRRTPVAFSTISPLKIREELGTQDLPMILNSTPGIHATQTGGGDGDSRVNIRGFNNRNVAVMVDGIPMNDMENGTVYWSNWFGLDVVTKSVQVQRGLGASKLAIPSIGGTINIMSDGIEEKEKVVIGTEYGNNNNSRISFGYNSGRLAKGWGITGAISAKYNEGWVDQLGSKQLYYFLKVQKQYEKNSFSFTVMGSPQRHNQRVGRQRITYYDYDYADKLGIDTTDHPASEPLGNYGVRHNEYWGTVIRTRDGETEEETVSSRVNYYHKPIVNFKHLWTANEKFALSNIVYASFGNGGGTAINNSIYTNDRQTDFQALYNNNITGYTFFGTYYPPYDLNLVNDTSKYKAENYILSRINNHVWYGLLSTFKYKATDRLQISGGVDARYYRTDRYQIIYDLLGADYAVPAAGGDDLNNPTNVVKYEGDRFGYNISSYVRQGGIFGLAEYSGSNWTAFLNATGSISSYNRVNYYLKKNEDGSYQSSGWKTFPAGTVKTGFNYNIDEVNSVFFNAGFISRAPMMSNTYVQTTINTYINLKNEEVRAIEAGYLFSNKRFKPSVNIYYTKWNNRPVVGNKNLGTELVYFNVPGMNAVHKGVEFEFEYKVIEKVLDVEGAFSIGDWKWDSDATVVITDEAGTTIIDEFKFDAKGVYVGDAAQLQTSVGVRYSPIKGFYIKPRFTYFDKYYSDFDPDGLQDENAGRQSWKIPAYYTLDLNMGYGMQLGENKNKLSFKVNLINLTNLVYISDARNNEYDQGFDAASAGVFMGMGFRWNVGAQYTF